MFDTLIGSLRVALGLDTAEFQNGAKRAQGSLSALGGVMKGFAAGALGALSFGAVTAVLKSAVDRMDDLGKSAQKIGIPVEQLSSLGYAAKLADADLGTVQASVKKLNNQLAELAGGGTNAAGDALKAMGISALDVNGKLRPTSDLLLDVAEKFSRYKDGAEKSALASALFGGKVGIEMIPFLNQGSQAIKELQEEASRFGIVVDKEAAVAAERFNDNLTRLTAAGQGFVQRVAMDLLPGLVSLTDQLIEAAKKSDSFGIVSRFVREELAGVAAGVLEATHEFRAFIEVTSALLDIAVNKDAFMDMSGRWKVAMDNIAKDADITKARIESMRETLAVKPTITDKEGSGVSFGSNSSNTEQGDPPVVVAAKKVKKHVDEAAKALEKLKSEGQSVWEETRTPMENYQLGIRHLNDLLQQGVIDHQTYDRAVRQLQDGFNQTSTTVQEASHEIRDVFQSSIMNGINSAIEGTFKWSDALKNVLSSLANIALNDVFEKLLSGGSHPLYGGGGGGGFLGNLLGGLFGFASGGTILPGGTGGIDSQLVMMRKSPNERVDISKPGQTLTSGSSSPTVIVDQRTNAPPIEQGDYNGSMAYFIRDAVKQELPGALRKQMSSAYGINARPNNRG